MRFNVKNFTDAEAVSIEGCAQNFPSKKGRTPLVCVTQYSGCMSFNLAMRPEQARFMATALQMAADEAEAIVGSGAEAAA